MSQLQVGKRTFNILDNVPEEYTALSDAISRLFYVCGSGKLCGACFQGKLVDHDARSTSDETIRKHRVRHPNAFASVGCCGGCSNLSSTGCVQKPLGCAGWQCPYSAMLLPERISAFLNGSYGRYAAASARRGMKSRPDHLHTWLYKRTHKDLFEYFRISGFNIQLNATERKALAIVAKRVNRIADWLERTGLNKPNWPLMQRITRAEKGVLYEPSV